MLRLYLTTLFSQQKPLITRLLHIENQKIDLATDGIKNTMDINKTHILTLTFRKNENENENENHQHSNNFSKQQKNI